MVVPHDPCWGAQLQGWSACGRVRDWSSRHFKSKFCADCKYAMAVPATRVRVLTDDLAYALENRRSFGMWTIASPMMHGFRYRIVNNTHDCFGDRLIVFEHEPPSDIAWTPVDPELVDNNGMVQMCVSRGTAVPLKYVQIRNNRRKRPPPPDAGSETPTLCEVIVPSALVVGLAEVKQEPISPVSLPSPLASLPSPPASLPSPPPSPTPLETRKQRNRASAAKSRVQKRKYIESLELQVTKLTHTVHVLTEENQFWKSLGIVRGDVSCPLAACEAFSPE